MELEGKTVLITPEMAEEFLKHNTRNRNIRLPYVEELATYMRQGKWDVTHQGIGFYEDGTLFDGQHRLHAIIKAGVPVNDGHLWTPSLQLMRTRGEALGGRPGKADG